MSKLKNILKKEDDTFVHYMLTKLENQIHDILSQSIAENNVEICNKLFTEYGQTHLVNMKDLICQSITQDNVEIFNILMSYSVKHNSRNYEITEFAAKVGRHIILKLLLQQYPEHSKNIFNLLLGLKDFRTDHVECLKLFVGYDWYLSVNNRKMYSYLKFLKKLTNGETTETSNDFDSDNPNRWINRHILKYREWETYGLKMRNAIISYEDQTLKYMVRNGSPAINEITIYNETPLMTGASYGRPDVVNLLLENGADVTITNKWKKSALDYAVMHYQSESFGKKNIQCIKLLIRGGINIDSLKIHPVDYAFIKLIQDSILNFIS